MRSPSLVRAAVLLAGVLDLPVLGRAVRRLTGDPVVELWHTDGVEVEVVRPPGDGPWPAWLFVNGAHPERREEPVVQRLSRGLARAGYLVFVPDVPGLGEGTITRRTLETTAAVTSSTVRRHDVAGERVALIGASTGAALALLVAAREDLAEHVSAVAAVAPFADLERMICLSTTCGYAENGGFTRYEVTELQRQVVERSLRAAVADDAEPATRAAVVAVLENTEPERFAELFRSLPADVRELLTALTPLQAAPRIRAPVEIVVPPADVYFPLGEANALAAAIPHAHLTVTGTLDHTRPDLSLGRLRDLVSFLRFVVRGLAAAG